jgi:hypothetical protein
MKNTIYLVVIVLCIVLAAVVFFWTRAGGSGGIENIKRGEKSMWVKCKNPECNAEYQMDMRDYYEQTQEKIKANPLSSQTPPLTCKECGEESVFRAEKCEKCGTVFFYGVSKDYPDRCTKCGYSKTEATRQERLRQRGR